ncbi:MAG: hypothetical protein QG646_637 [Euryarchaeota archaeon]|nr:hypothetical protein [Euryarchaeota archaeon]
MNPPGCSCSSKIIMSLSDISFQIIEYMKNRIPQIPCFSHFLTRIEVIRHISDEHPELSIKATKNWKLK